jgi:hypothetical protein
VLADVDVLDRALEEFFFRRHGRFQDINFLGATAGFRMNFGLPDTGLRCSSLAYGAATPSRQKCAKSSNQVV